MKHLAIIALACLTCSCATVVRGTNDTAKFEGEPGGTKVVAESVSEDRQGPYTCTAPCSMELKRKRTWRVDFSLDGYQSVSGILKPVLTGGGLAAGAGNALIGGIIGVGIDAGTGANLDLRPNPMVAILEPVGAPAKSRILDAENVAAEDAGVESGVPVAPADAAPSEVPEPQIEEQTPIIEEAISALNNQAESDTERLTPASAESIDAKARLYKPGEPAPDDEEASKLNSMQLDKIKSGFTPN